VSAQESRPVLRVVRGDATPEELAALVAVLAAAGGAEGAADPRDASPSRWTDHAASVRAPLQPGPGAWRASALPR
jgi:hypothetical protein